MELCHYTATNGMNLDIGAVIQKGKPMRLIDADALIDNLAKAIPYFIDDAVTEAYVEGLVRARCEIDNSPTIEPERKKGKWEKGGEQPYFRKHFDIVVCSICNKRGEHRWNFCPNCGADMRERRTDG